MLSAREKQYFKSKFISIAMPAYNEEKTIAVVVRNAINVLKKLTSRYQVLIVDDGSTDRTGNILDMLAKKDKHVRVIHFKKNKGVGQANHTIYTEAKGDILFWNASDNQIHMDELFFMLPKIIDNDIVVGNRALRADSIMRRFGSALFSKLLRLRFRIPVRDIDSVKVYRVLALRSIMPKSRTAFIESEILIKAVRKRLRIIEIPIKHHPRTKGKAKGIMLKIITPQLIELAKAFFKFRWD